MSADRFANLRPSEIARVLVTENAGAQRYLVIPDSLGGHGCCFDQSVVDTGTLDADGDPRLLCECVDEQVAARIAAALNAQEVKCLRRPARSPSSPSLCCSTAMSQGSATSTRQAPPCAAETRLVVAIRRPKNNCVSCGAHKVGGGICARCRKKIDDARKEREEAGKTNG